MRESGNVCAGDFPRVWSRRHAGVSAELPVQRRVHRAKLSGCDDRIVWFLRYALARVQRQHGPVDRLGFVHESGPVQPGFDAELRLGRDANLHDGVHVAECVHGSVVYRRLHTSLWQLRHAEPDLQRRHWPMVGMGCVP